VPTLVNDLPADCGVELHLTKGALNDHEMRQDREDYLAEFKKLFFIVLDLFFKLK